MNDKLLMLISFLVALVLWAHVYISENREVAIKIPVTLLGEKEGSMAFLHPKEAEVTMSVPQALVNRATNDAKIFVHVSDYPLGITIIRLTTKDVRAPGFEVLDISPSGFELEVQPTIKKSLRVQPFIIDEPHNGYKMGTVKVTPSSVEVEGARDLLTGMEGIQTSYISIAGLSDNSNFSVSFQSYDRIKFITPSKVNIEVSIVPDNITRGYEAVPVKCVQDMALNVASNPKVDVKVDGRRDLVESLPQDIIFAYIDCGSIEGAGVYTLEVMPADIQGINILSIEPDTVTLEVLQ